MIETIGKSLPSGVSSAGKDLAHKEPGTFIFQPDIHGAFKGRSFKRDHRLGMKEKGSSFLYENRGMSACLSFFHAVDLIVGLGDELCPGAFFYMKRKFLKISCHDSRGSSQQHDLDPAAFQGKGLHDLKGRGIRKVFQYGLAFTGTCGNGKAGDFSIGIFFFWHYIPSKSTFFLIHSTTCSTCSPLRILVNRKGRSPRIFLESLSITSRLAPT